MRIIHKRKEVSNCGSCPFYATIGHEMTCRHPYFDDKDSYAGLIITRSNIHGKPPEECPLKTYMVKTWVYLNGTQ